MQLPDTAAWFCASNTGRPVEYDLLSTTSGGKRMGYAGWSGLEPSSCWFCKALRKSLASRARRPFAFSFSITVVSRRPIVMSGRGVFTMEMSCLGGGGGGGIEGPELSKGMQDGGMADSDRSGEM